MASRVDQQNKELVDLLLDSTTDPSTYYQGEYNHYIEGHQYVYPNLDVNGTEREWPDYTSFMKIPDASNQVHPMAAQYLSPSEGYNQDEAQFVQNFAVQQQQPFLPYTAYLPGFPQAFSNNMYSMYPFVGQYGDGAQYVSPDGQPFFALHPTDSYPNDPHLQMYQPIETAMEGLTIKDHTAETSEEVQHQEAQKHQPDNIVSVIRADTTLNIPNTKPKPEGPRSWADVLAAPAPKAGSGVMKTALPQPGPLVSKGKPKVEHMPHEDSNKQKKHGPPFDRCNPSSFDYNPTYARFFVIKSYSEDDIHKAIKYNTWASTDSGNRKLDTAFRESAALGPIYLLFSVNANYSKKCEYWAQDKWNGQFSLTWIFIKDIPNVQFRHIRLSYPCCGCAHTNNENKPVTNSRDTQEVLLEPGKEILRIFTTFQSKTSILDDFTFYDKRQEMMQEKKIQGGEPNIESGDAKQLPVVTGEGRKKNTGKPAQHNTQHGIAEVAATPKLAISTNKINNQTGKQKNSPKQKV